MNKKGTTPGNYLIRMQGGKKERNGVRLIDEPQHLSSFSGTVILPPSSLYFPLEEYNEAKEIHCLHPVSSMMFSETCEHLGPIAPRGSKCIFSYLVDNCPTVRYYGVDMKVVHQNYLVAYFTRRDVMVPVNNWVVFRMLEKEDAFDRNDYGSGIVVAASEPVMDFHLGSVPEIPLKKGDRIFFNEKMSARFEKDHLNTMTDGQSSLFRVQRKYIGYVNKG